ncbi:uncharacterized protein TM35_000082850 [Trypanosoma theileri]|uniref:Uncharacterized protein n=1 Tax=Trypanosoma theileri TaxID=67003 RepID=A0A1X0P0M0_9TRYP|nr:uncharacterized protein TM35_000082850 [Trypanosoma theileri]ORC90487.1 hypothetical protein TM35_000082850 [Trypanosoma theileri]
MPPPPPLLLPRQHHPLVAAVRHVHSGVGRGDLRYVNPSGWRHGTRAIGPLRGLRHSSQATAPASGQLHYKKLFLHAVGDAPASGSEAYRHAACTWTYLIPSLLRCAEQGVKEELWDKLCHCSNGSGEAQGEIAELSERERQQLRDGQNFFRYELHQRLPLLEDSVVSADLQQLLGWFYAARRAWVRLPITDQLFNGSNEKTNASCLMPVGNSLALSCDVLSRLNASDATRDVIPGRHQIYNMTSRVAQLTDFVLVRVHDEINLLGTTSTEKGRSKSLRLVAKERKFRQLLADELRWHGIPDKLSLS